MRYYIRGIMPMGIDDFAKGEQAPSNDYKEVTQEEYIKALEETVSNLEESTFHDPRDV